MKLYKYVKTMMVKIYYSKSLGNKRIIVHLKYHGSIKIHSKCITQRFLLIIYWRRSSGQTINEYDINIYRHKYLYINVN